MTDAKGWTRFLTEQDTALLDRTSWAKREPFGLGERPAVVVVDAYYGALGERRPLEEILEAWPSACGPAGWDAVDRTVGLLDAARAAGAPVFYLTGLAANPNPWNRKARRSSRRRDPNFLRIVDELAPQPGDTVLEKVTPSGFTSSALAPLLTAAGVDTVLVCGEATSGCVRATAVDACVIGHRVGVVEDCCFDRIEASHWMSLFDLDQKYADVIDRDAAITYLEGTGRKGTAS
ncbi:isochorismatase family protein [Pseudonocardia benzenivorans]|uniref:Isochorismatase hydrolase n=2 Tax=Pseudonocardia TaxID=1847 RepID=F4CPY6_PSEUX|nr:isochorismatase family protein [Pseudonocardia dioxanivorans]AEA27182.1 isochorismatase hydrolase [Pseudonocardia dioxanivorans CB1190]GJF07195.1 N-carbamoylsarcosine amidase [Pseudonocardia sp. D17]